MGFILEIQQCRNAFVNWTTLTNLDANDDSIILDELDCEENSFACKSIIEVSGFPTFFIMFKGETHPVFTDRSIESFAAEVEFIRTVDPTLPCALDPATRPIPSLRLFVHGGGSSREPAPDGTRSPGPPVGRPLFPSPSI
jgi:hypothetical protein